MATTLASTSGDYGTTVMDVTSIIEHAVRRCGVSAALITAEQQESAKDNLFLILSNLATKGLSLWCVQKYTLSIPVGAIELLLPVGVVDLLEALYRTATTYLSTTTNPLFNSAAVMDPLSGGASASIAGVVITAVSNSYNGPLKSGTYDFTLESSPDNITWTARGAARLSFSGTPIGFDASTLVSAPYWRVKSALLPNSSEFLKASFLANPFDIPIGVMARDSYAQLPNKTQASNQPLQCWFDKQFYQPRLVVWPVPTIAAYMRIYVQTQIQDPGSFTNTVQVPQRWLDTIISLLAPRVCLELPKELVPPDRYATLVTIAAETLRDAEDSETDGAPIRFVPNLAPYTK